MTVPSRTTKLEELKKEYESGKFPTSSVDLSEGYPIEVAGESVNNSVALKGIIIEHYREQISKKFGSELEAKWFKDNKELFTGFNEEDIKGFNDKIFDSVISIAEYDYLVKSSPWDSLVYLGFKSNAQDLLSANNMTALRAWLPILGKWVMNKLSELGTATVKMLQESIAALGGWLQKAKTSVEPYRLKILTAFKKLSDGLVHCFSLDNMKNVMSGLSEGGSKFFHNLGEKINQAINMVRGTENAPSTSRAAAP